jgi:hypothetical protein
MQRTYLICGLASIVAPCCFLPSAVALSVRARLISWGAALRTFGLLVREADGPGGIGIELSEVGPLAIGLVEVGRGNPGKGIPVGKRGGGPGGRNRRGGIPAYPNS